MTSLAHRIASRDALLLDGAIGTSLLAYGLTPGRCPESMTLSHGRVLEEIARSYVDAGSDVVGTNTFGASPLRLAIAGLASDAEAINREAVRAARAGAGGRAAVLASCGPSGRLLQPHGDTEAAEVFESFRVQIGYLVGAGIDGLCIETMTDLEEAVLAVRAARETSSDLPVLATMTFDATPRGFFTIMGVTVEAAAAGLAGEGADAVGSNCGNGAEQMVQIGREFRRHTELPVVIQPNAGMPQTRDGLVVYDETPAFMAERAADLLAAGVTLIGGCCGTTPEHIRALRGAIDAEQGG